MFFGLPWPGSVVYWIWIPFIIATVVWVLKYDVNRWEE